jgi:transposase
MELHANAPLGPIGRRRVVDRVVGQRWSVAAAAEAAGVTERTVYRWLVRWRAEGPTGLIDRRSVPGRIPHKTPRERVAVICELRRGRLTAAEIAERLAMPLSTISAVLLREGLGKRSRLAPETVRPSVCVAGVAG